MINSPASREDTICAVSTPQGVGGISVIRLSGKESISIVKRIFTPQSIRKDLLQERGYTLHFGSIFLQEQLLDEVLISLFKAPHSFTGEDVIELSCHGSLYIQQTILELLIQNGARMALPGEFTQRAFLNGKMDLAQAEAVADLIASDSRASHKLAISQIKGGFSLELTELRNQLLQFTALIELELDFSEEDVSFADRVQLKKIAGQIHHKIFSLTESFSLGNAIKKGIPVAIIGQTNAGKSTLLNALLKEQKAIVSNIHGTTRDVIEDTFLLHGILFRFIDTAGIRNTQDEIESIGIERSFSKIESASIVLWMIDSTDDIENWLSIGQQVLERTEAQNIIPVFNKMDLVDQTSLQSKASTLLQKLSLPSSALFINAKEKENLSTLEQTLISAAHLPEIGQNDIVVTNARHYEALKHAGSAIERAIDGLNAGISGDFLSQDIRECIFYLGEISGKITNDEVLGAIFGQFCIGK